MAKKPPTSRKAGAARATRTIHPAPPDQVPVGGVGMVLSPQTGGIATTEDAQSAEEERQQQIRQAQEQFLTLARDRFKMSANAESQLRRDMLEDLRFYNSEQWPDKILSERTLDNRVTLTINRLPQFIRQVVNQARQSKPAIQVNPIDNGADPDTAEVLQGICRNIERQSRASVAYATATEHQAIMGRGWWRVVAEYARDDSMEQEIRIKRVADAFTVYPDPAASEVDHSDGTFCFVVERLNKTVYQAKYGKPNQQPLSALEFQSLGDDTPIWLNDNGVQVAEYFYVEHVTRRIADVMFSPGAGADPVRITVNRDAIRPEQLKPSETTRPAEVVILKERNTVQKQVKWALINGVEILDGNPERTAGRDLPGSYIPVVPVLGEELIVNGRRNLRGMVRDAISPQRAYNYWVSSATEKIALSTKSPIVVAVGQVEGLEDKWDQANRRNWSYLEYNPVDLNGQLVPPPQRAAYTPDVQVEVAMTAQADRDLKSVLGMFDASQERSPEQSGKAILARQAQGEQGTSHFLDNLARSIEHTGRILLEWIPIYYDAPRMLRINGIDEQPKDVLVHAGQASAADDFLGKLQDRLRTNILSGRPFDLAVGRYDVTISTGPSYQSRRQEAVASMIQLVQAYPQVLPLVGDILVENMDWPGARQLSERLKRLVPPEAQDPVSGEEIPPAVQAQMRTMQQQLQIAMAKIAEQDRIIQTKAQELAAQGEIKMADIASRERVAYIQEQSQLLQAELKANTDKGLALLNATLQEIKLRLDQAHDEKMADKKAKQDRFVPPNGGTNPAAPPQPGT